MFPSGTRVRKTRPVRERSDSVTQQDIDATNEEIETISNLATRVAARKADGEPVPDEDLDRLTEAGDWLDAEAAAFTDAADDLTAMADECEALRERVSGLLDGIG
jgi:hypothetical protein